MNPNTDRLEIAWLLLAVVLLVKCLPLLLDALRDWRIIKRRAIHGPLKTVAWMTTSGAILRTCVAIVVCAAAILSATHPTPDYTYTMKFYYFKPLWLILTACLALNVVLDRRCRARLRRYLDMSGERRGGRRSTDIMARPSSR